jgi:hypothetical protein
MAGQKGNYKDRNGSIDKRDTETDRHEGRRETPAGPKNKQERRQDKKRRERQGRQTHRGRHGKIRLTGAYTHPDKHTQTEYYPDTTEQTDVEGKAKRQRLYKPPVHSIFVLEFVAIHSAWIETKTKAKTKTRTL